MERILSKSYKFKLILGIMIIIGILSIAIESQAAVFKIPMNKNETYQVEENSVIVYKDEAAAQRRNARKQVAVLSKGDRFTVEKVYKTPFKNVVKIGKKKFIHCDLGLMTIVEKCVPVKKINMKSALTVVEKYSGSLNAAVSPTNASYKTISYKSSNTNIATVNSSGVVTGRNKGIATITATADGVSATCKVTVNKDTFKIYELYNKDGSVNTANITKLEKYIEKNYLGGIAGRFMGNSSYASQKRTYAKYWDDKTYNDLEKFQCTWWARGRANQYLESRGKTKISGQTGDAKDLGTNLGKLGFKTGSTPKEHSLITWGASRKNPHGHVGFVEAVDKNGTIYVSHTGGAHAWYGIVPLTKSQYSTYSGMAFKCFIYLD